jgi:dTDP-glucose 4,6-dehydratase
LHFAVAGSAGFVGSHLCERLLADGHTVTAIDNFITGAPRNLDHLRNHPGFSFVEHDVCLPLTLGGNIDIVMNLASPASPKDYFEYPLETLDVGSNGTRNLLELARAHSARSLLASTSECYGDPDVHPQREDYWGNVNPVGPRSCYDEAKRFAEAVTMAYHRKYGMRTSIARIFNTYGPRMKLDDGRVVPNLIDQALKGLPLTVYGNGSQTRSFCYVSDLVDGLIRLSLSGEPYPVNLGNPHEMTVLEFAQAVRAATGSSSPFEYLPLPTDDPRRRRPDIAKAERLLGWSPLVSFADGLALTIDHIRRQQTVGV